MLKIKCFIFSLFLWLSFTTTSPKNAVNTAFYSQLEIKKLSNNTNQYALIVDNTLKVNRDNWTLKNFKIPFKLTKNKLKQPIAKTYDYKLNYLSIGETIPLKLTSTTIIFPFHFFT
ncbi:hypothetical protein [uncultured Polaribacter sp.]|uniref:hypothetical protein n=1 Tax=uncultured Polaribacter sp. TaxID=174711 RepID=UPI0030D6D9D9|tara:strand:- start:34514 stop:34861 length:348 start_codon:yes stop_codon:yes gene_type:complete